jgi:hypothetical protein
MHIHSRLAAAFGCVATLAMVGCATNGGGVTPVTNTTLAAPDSVAAIPNGWREQGGVMVGPNHYMLTRERTQALGKRKHPDTQFSYYGGLVETTPSVVLILWDFKKYGDPDKIGTLLQTYQSNMGGSGHNNIYTQYYQDIDGTTTYITNPTSVLTKVVNYKKKAPTAPSEFQMAQVAVNVANDLKLGTGINTSYVVVAPYHHDPAGYISQGWCAYHSTARATSGTISWTNMPYMPDGGASCGANIITPPADESAVDEGQTIVEGHEQGESVTDPIPGLGWYNSTYGEIGDICAWDDIQNDTFGSYSYTMQPMWSNATDGGSCVHTYYN